MSFVGTQMFSAEYLAFYPLHDFELMGTIQKGLLHD